VPVFFLALGANSIWDANEAFYVETARQMVISGDYVNPSFNEQPRFNKPVLSYWIVAAAYHLLGVSVAAERLTIALGALGMIVAAWLIGRALRSPLTGIVAALVLATAPRIVFFARRIVIDVYVALFMTIALACFVLAERHPERRRRYLILMYVALGLGVLTKGPIAIVIPAAACLAWLVTERRLDDLRRLMIPTGTAIVLAITVPWYAAVYAGHGWEYIAFFFRDENLGRFTTALTTERSPGFFLFALFGDVLMPWAPLLLVPMLTAWRRRDPSADNEGGAIRRLLWWWIVVTVGIFSLSASKEDLYILPAMPAAAVLIADALVGSGFGATHRGVRALFAIVAVVSVAIGVLVAMYFTRGHYALAGAWVLAGLLAGAGVFAIVQLLRRRYEAAFLSLAGGFVAFNYLFVLIVLPDVERLKPGPAIATLVADRASSAASLASLHTDLPSLVFYTARPVERLPDADAAVRFLTDHAEAWLWMSDVEWQGLTARVPEACVALRRPQFLAKGSDILRGQPPPDVLVVTTACAGQAPPATRQR
jgi:4-amino-4-deoxy-L-arabinose transferase-like glycosyltransferase